MSAQFKQQIRYGVFGLRHCFEWDPCCSIFSLLSTVLSSFRLVLYCMCFYSVNSLYRQAFL